MKLSFKGFFLLFLIFSCILSKAQTTLIPAGTSWKYSDNGLNPGSNWKTLTFNDASWKTGTAELGFGDSPATKITSGKIGYFFRKIINVSNPTLYSAFTLKIRRDDGIVIHINNTEVYRTNMKSGTINYNTTASTNCSDDGNTTYTVNLPVSGIISGNNIIAAEVHNYNTSSSDLTFELQLLATPAPVICNTPDATNFAEDSITETSARLFWNSANGAVGYNIKYRSLNGSQSFSTAIGTNSTWIYLINLNPSTTYEYIVQSGCQNNSTSVYSTGNIFTTLSNAVSCNSPDATSFIYRNIKYNAATVAWTPIPGAESYNIRYKTTAAGGTFSNPLNSQTDSVVLTNLTASTGYELIVQAICPGSVFSTYSASTFFTTAVYTPPPACAVPNTNRFGNQNRTATSVQVFWSPVNTAISYNVQYRKRNVGAGYSASILTNDTLLLLSNLQPSTNYEFRVQSICSGASSATSSFSSSGWFTTLAAPPTLSITRGPYLTVAKSDSITIQWRTNMSSNSYLRYGTDLSLPDLTFTDTNQVTEHLITLSNLTPNTKYYYSVGSTTSVLQGDSNNFFYTAPLENDTGKIRFWVTGDFGDGSAGQLAARNSFTTFTAGLKINGWLWLGDNAYANGTDNEYQTKVFNVYQSIFKQLPVFPAPGNHDYAQSGYLSINSLTTNFPYFSIFDLPKSSGTEKYYSTNYGDVHLISLDSYGAYNDSGSLMHNWLINDLQNNLLKWTIAYFHHPPYSKGSHDSDTEAPMVDMRENLIPLLESHGVDLVLCGHSHTYERSYFIKNHTGTESTFDTTTSGNHIVQSGGGPYYKYERTGPGTVYQVCGVSGAPETYVSAGYPHNAMFKSFSNLSGSLILEIDSNSLTSKFINTAGVVADEFTIYKELIPEARFSAGQNKVNRRGNAKIFPNPANGDIHIRINHVENMEVSVSITGTAGEEIYRKSFLNIPNEELIITRGELKIVPGIYFVAIKGWKIDELVTLVIN